MTSEGILERLGCKLHYWISGAENAPLVVFSHGATLDHRMFEGQIEALVAAGYRVLSWDMRGHGLSKPMGEAFRVRIAAEDLLAILDALKVEKAVFIGHSFGDFVSQEFAFRNPQRLIALGVIGCTDLSEKPALRMAIANKIMPYLLPLFSLESFRQQTVAEVSLKPENKAYAYECTGKFSKAEFLEVIMAGLECLAVDSGFSEGYTIPVPFLLSHGAQDKANNGIFPRTAPDWLKKEPKAIYQVIPEAGHTANQDNPAAFNTILLDFLSEHVRG